MNHVTEQHPQSFMSGTYSDTDADSQKSFWYWDYIDISGGLVLKFSCIQAWVTKDWASFRQMHVLACLTEQHRVFSWVKLKMLVCMQES